MVEKDKNNSREYELELYHEFQNEKNVTQLKYDSNVTRIQEIINHISVMAKNEDIDFNVFSPRHIPDYNIEKKEELESERKQLERENETYLSQLKVIDDRIEKVSSMIDYIGGNYSAATKSETYTNLKGKSVIKNKNIMQNYGNKKIDSESMKNQQSIVENDTARYKYTLNETTDENVLLNINQGKTDISRPEDNTNSIVLNKKNISRNGIIKKDNIVEYNSDFLDSILEPLESILHKTDMCSKIILSDSNRVKLELELIKKHLETVVNSIRNI